MMNKKAIMGIGTLIIFIATILVAAVAAGVIISTSGVLQQRALLVADQSEQRLINGVQITHVFVEGDLVTRTANNMELLARPEPASGPINLKTTSLSFFTNERSYSATYSHPEMIEIESTPSGVIATAPTYSSIGADLDGDGIEELAAVEDNGASNDDFVLVNISSENVIARANVGDTYAATLEVEDASIVAPSGMIYGYVHVNDSSPSGGQLNGNTATFTDEFRGECTFEKLRPEERYCSVTMVGTADTILEYGENVYLYYKMRPSRALDENEEFEVKLFPQDGRSTFVLDRIPPVINEARIGVYP